GLRQGRSFTETSHNILKAMNILAELMGILNPEPSRELADRLLSLYSYMLDRLGLALKERDHAPVDEVTRLLRELEGAWVEAEKRWAEEKPRGSPSRPAGIAL
ncbi:MAG: flagellar export chaperone FliS, partial [Nitrospinota bacterium]